MNYLTPELKEYYMKDFNNNVLKCEDEFWDLDEGLEDILIKINKSDKIQTLYSRRFTGDLGKNGDNDVSTLWILLSEEGDNGRFAEFIDECGSNIRLFEFMYCPPEYLVQNMDKTINIGCMQDGDYFNSGAIMIRMCGDMEDHNLFWSLVEKYLPNL